MQPVNITLPESPFAHMNLTFERKSILILGNGFDLCAGLESSFSSFAKSDYWPLKGRYPYGSLPHFLNDRKNLSTWFDMEQELFKYAHAYNCQVNKSNHDIDQQAFEEIHIKLRDYLIDQVNNFEVKSNIPNLIIKLFQVLPGKNKQIYTFNYTSPATIIEKMGGQLDIPVKYVHGNLSDNNIILGVGDSQEVCEQYEFLYKAMSHHYRSTDIVAELENADDVFFFGHSLGKNDYDYFTDFFQKACESRNGLHPQLRITVFTKDNQDEIAVKTRIREMSDKRLQKLTNMCKFRIVPTDNSDGLQSFIEEYLKETVLQNKKRRL